MKLAKAREEAGWGVDLTYLSEHGIKVPSLEPMEELPNAESQDEEQFTMILPEDCIPGPSTPEQITKRPKLSPQLENLVDSLTQPYVKTEPETQPTQPYIKVEREVVAWSSVWARMDSIGSLRLQKDLCRDC